MNKLKVYLIRNITDPFLYWNHNRKDWFEMESFWPTVYTEEESKNLDLPDNGEWLEFKQTH